MKGFKILGIPIVIIFTLFVLTSSVILPKSKQDRTISTNKIDKPSAEAILLYKAHQEALKEALANYFEKAIASGDIVGAGVSIVRGDSIVISDGFGKRNIKYNDAVDGETVFRLGSLSKGFAGVLAANLKHEGKLDWSDKVSDYLPDFQLGNKQNSEQITLATILSHTSGAPYHSYTNLVEAGLPLTEIASRFKAVVPNSKPGLTYSYQNAMFALSAEMMYKETGEEMTALLNTKFFKPLNMDHISMDHETLAHTDNVAMPHSKRRYGWTSLKLNDHYYNAIAAGGINASALDMAKWMKLLLGHHPEIMDKTALQEAFNPFIEIKGRSKYYQRWPGHVSSYYGFGWRIHKFEDMVTNEHKTIFHHGGSVNSYRNEIAIYPEADLGICVLLNSNSKLAGTVIPDLYEIVNKVYNEVNSKMPSNTNKLASAISE
jgi:beta-lactamase class C